MNIDREALDDRVEELQELVDEYQALSLFQMMLYCADEGFIDIDEAGRCFPKGLELCPKDL